MTAPRVAKPHDTKFCVLCLSGDHVVLPTANCTVDLHEKYGGACYHCCERCNVDRHLCHFCGENLRHDDTLQSGAPNPCYEEVQR